MTSAIAIRTLYELEAVVEAGLHTFVEVGAALAEIRERRLYRESHNSFEAYCSDRYGLKRQRAYELMEAADVVAKVSEISDTAPVRESHAAALAPLREDPPAMVEALAEAHEETDGKLTAAALERAVDRRRTRPVPVVIEPESLEIIEPAPHTEPPTNHGGELLLIADLAAFLRDEYLTRIVAVDGSTSRHDRHCDYGKPGRTSCYRRCVAAQALLQRAELI